MTRRALLAVVAVVALPLMTAVVATAGTSDLGAARSATARFHQLDAAQAAGYTVEVADVNGFTCIDDIVGHTGAMGVHFLNPSLLDGNVDESTPELVIYEPTKNGGMRLVGVEYIVVKAAWEAAHPGSAAPSLFGRPMELVPAGNRYGLPDFYELHAWIWKNDPLGMNNDWNPAVTCANA